MRRARLLVVAMLAWSHAATGQDVRDDPESIVALPATYEIAAPAAACPAATGTG